MNYSFYLLASIALLASSLRSTPGHAQTPTFDQAIACTSSANGYANEPKRIATDAQGNMIITGEFGGTVALGGAIITAAGTSAGPALPIPPDVFVAKFNVAGNYVWAVQNSGTLAEYVADVAVDAVGDVYITGAFESYSVAFGPSITLYNSSARSEAFVAKLSGATGQWLWARRCGGGNNEYPAAIAVTAQGEVYIAGRSDSMTADFGLTILTNSQYGDAFLAKLTTTGTWLWARQAGSGKPTISDMELDGQGNIYLAGTFYPSVSFGPTTLVTQMPRTSSTYAASPGADIFVAKTTDAGGWLWATQGDPNGQNMIYPPNLALDGLGHLYLGGSYSWLNARIGGVLLPNASNLLSTPGAPAGQVTYGPDAFAARLNAATGAWEWTIRAGGAQGDGISAIAADGQGRVYIASGGYNSGGIDNPLPGVGRVHLAQLDGATGAWRWTMPLAGAQPSTLCLDASQRVIIAGFFAGSSASFGSIILAQQGGTAGTTVYLARLGAGPLATHAPTVRPNSLQVWPNPSAGGTVQVQGPAPGQAVQVLDGLGRVVATGSMPARGVLSLALPATTAAGLYVVRSIGQARQLVVE